MTLQQALSFVCFVGILFGCLLGEATRRRDKRRLEAFDLFGWGLLLVAIGLVIHYR